MPLRTASVHAKKGEPKMFEGRWLGTNARIENKSVSTFLLHSMKGTHLQPVPRYASNHISVGIFDEGLRPDRTQEDSDDVDYKPVLIDEDHARMRTVHQGRQTGIRISHTDIGKYGATPGCRACEHLQI